MPYHFFFFFKGKHWQMRLSPTAESLSRRTPIHSVPLVPIMANVSQRLLLYTTRQRPSHWNGSSQLLANGRASLVSPMAISLQSQICRISSICASPGMSALLHNLWGMAIPKHDVAHGAAFPKREKQLGQSDGIASSAPMAATLRFCIKHSRVSSGHQIDIVKFEG